MAYIYKHVRLDTNTIFYIGIGEDKEGKVGAYKRAYVKSNRGKHWKNIVSKTAYQVEILEDNLSWLDAQQKEKELISFYGRSDLGLGSLCNKTNGGEGTKGRIVSDLTKQRIGSGNKGHKMSEAQKTQVSEFHKGVKQTPESIRKRVLKLTGQKRTKEQRLLMSKTWLGRHHTLESVEKIRKAKLGTHYEGITTLVLDLETGIFYNSIHEAAKAKVINQPTLFGYLKGQRRNKTSLTLA